MTHYIQTGAVINGQYFLKNYKQAKRKKLKRYLILLFFKEIKEGAGIACENLWSQ